MTGKVLRGLFLSLLALGFALPLALTAAFSLAQGQAGYGVAAYAALLSRADLLQPLLLTFALAAATIAVVGVVMLPAVVAMHLWAPRLRVVLDAIAVLPFVIPVVALVAGLSALIHGPGWLVGSPFYLVLPYFVLVLPYAYRTLDVALSTLDLQQLGLAASSLGASRRRILLWVVLPNLWPALITAALMTFTVVLGEFTVANLLLFNTFPVSLNLVGKSEPTLAAALTIVSFALTWVALFGVLRFGRDRRGSGHHEAKP